MFGLEQQDFLRGGGTSESVNKDNFIHYYAIYGRILADDG